MMCNVTRRNAHEYIAIKLRDSLPIDEVQHKEFRHALWNSVEQVSWDATANATYDALKP